MPPRPGRPRKRVLVLDVGGTHVKVRFSGDPHRFQFASGPRMTPGAMVRRLRSRLAGRSFDVVTIGYPGLVRRGKILREPYHLANGWVAFDFRKALGHPVRIMNDAAMQALGSYEGGRMLFLGLGTGLGSAMIVDGRLLPMELAHLPYKKGGTYEEFVGEAALRRMGKKKWRKEVAKVVEQLSEALQPEYVVIGGGNLRKLDRLPASARPGDNDNAYLGGVRAWDGDPLHAGPTPSLGRAVAHGRSGRAGRA